MSANIESVLNETRVFPPSAAFVKQANVSGMAAYQALCDEAERDFEGFWARLARENLLWHEAVHEDARRVERAVLQVVPRRRAERLLQLPRPAPEDAARQGRDHLRGRRRQGDEGHLQGALSPRLPVRQRPQVARRQDGRPRARLHADVDRGGGGDAGLRAHRRDALGGVRRLLRQEPAGAHHRRRRHRGDHAPTASSAAARRSRSSPRSTRPSRWAAANRCAT